MPEIRVNRRIALRFMDFRLKWMFVNVLRCGRYGFGRMRLKTVGIPYD